MSIQFLETLLTVGKLQPDLSELTILPPGIVKLSGMAPILMDKEAADSIIAAFRDQGVDIPIDWEHAAVLKGARGEAAPAAAWVTDLIWDRKRGLIASVEWTAEGREMVESKQYKYLSPVVLVDEESRRPLALHSVALTNKPRIKGQEELLRVAASATVPLITRENDLMVTKTKEPPLWVQRVKGGKLKKVALADLTKLQVEGEAEEVVEDGGAVDEQQQAVLEEIVSIVDSFRELLVAWDVEIPEDATVVDVLNLVGELLMRLYEEVSQSTDTADTEDIAAEVTEEAAALSVLLPKKNSRQKPPPIPSAMFETELYDRLGLKRGVGQKAILASVDAMRGHVGYVTVDAHNEVRKRLVKIETERNVKNTEALVDRYVSQHKLNVYDETQMEWARKFARTDPEGFVSIMTGAKAIVPTGTVMIAPVTETGKSDRMKLILSAVAEYHDNLQVQRMCTLDSWINGELKEAQQTPVTKEELEKVTA